MDTMDEGISFTHWISQDNGLYHATKNLNIGNVVVVIDPDAARREWKVR
jgi:hypothetical protein